MSERFAGKVVVVFGAGASGPGWSNGKAASVLYARECGTVVAVDVSLDAAQQTCNAISAEGHSSLPLSADVTRSEDVARVIEEVMARHGRIDVLHNNVGVTVLGDPIELSQADWQRAFDLNVTGAFLACKQVLPIMIAQAHGAIVNVSSLASIQINQYPYVGCQAAKAALNHFTRAVAVRYAAQGVRANAVLPGVIDTPLVQQQLLSTYADVEEMKRARAAASPMGRAGDAWDVAHAAAFLASDDAKYITGVCLPVDGGKSCAGR
jgi:NAD(P)-dependent dehydrogenase (short-subunit alcohol dehydrogenase family)